MFLACSFTRPIFHSCHELNWVATDICIKKLSYFAFFFFIFYRSDALSEAEFVSQCGRLYIGDSLHVYVVIRFGRESVDGLQRFVTFHLTYQ